MNRPPADDRSTTRDRADDRSATQGPSATRDRTDDRSAQRDQADQPAGDRSPGDAPALVEVRGLTAHAQGATLLHGVDLDVPAGRVTALVGPSGSGKTTTALALLGEAAPGVRLRGSVRVAGRPVLDDSGVTPGAAELRGGTVAYLPQHPAHALNPARRTGAVLTELARLHRPTTPDPAPGPNPAPDGDAAPDGGALPGRNRTRRTGAAAARQRAAEGLRRAQLPADRKVLRRFPHQFSGGQRQRVALAQLLTCRPRVLVLDEPGTGLDTVTRMGLARELADLADGGPAVLLLSHDHDLVRALADHVVLLEGGRVAAEGPTAALLPARPHPVPPPRPAPEEAAPQELAPQEATREDATREEATREDATREDAHHTVRESPAPPENDDPSPESAPLLEVRGLNAWLRPTVRRGARRPVLHDLSLALSAGDALAVAGRSGSGKTTLARCLAGLHERHQGLIRLDGAPLPVLRRRDRATTRRVQYVWQEVRGSFDERRTVLDQVARTAVRLRHLDATEATAEAVALLDRLGVAEDTARRRPEGLSGGELQRAALARAVLAGPDVLVCDEITTALDPGATDLVLAEVARLRREAGTAVLWIGHDLDVLATVAERMLVLDGGRVVERGATADLLHAPRAEATQLLVQARDLGAGHLAQPDQPPLDQPLDQPSDQPPDQPPTAPEPESSGPRPEATV